LIRLSRKGRKRRRLLLPLLQVEEMGTGMVMEGGVEGEEEGGGEQEREEEEDAGGMDRGGFGIGLGRWGRGLCSVLVVRWGVC